MSARRLTIAGTLGALAAAAWLTFGDSGKAGVLDQRPKTAIESPGVALAANPLSETRLSALERRVRELESNAPAEVTLTELASETSSLRAPAKSAAKADPEDEAVRVDRWITEREAALRDEPIDARWSRETEAQLSQAFTEGAFHGTSLERMQCGSTFCAVVVRHEDAAARNDFERFAYVIPMGAQFLVRNAPDGRLETTAYFVRPEDDKADHPVRKL